MKKLLLIDGSNLIFRSYYATEKQDIRSLSDEPAGAIYGLIGMLQKIIDKEKPTHLFIALDTGKSTFRHEMYEEYKGKRTETPEKLKSQFSKALDLYGKMGIKSYGTDMFEADDLIASYAVKGKKEGFEVKVISGDKDLLQLIEPGINVLTPAMGFSKEVDYDNDVFYEKYEFSPKRFIEYKSLVGDSSDNIIGVAKVGDKTAKKLIKEYDTIDEIIQAAKSGEIKGKVGENIAVSEEIIYENLKLVELIKSVDVEIELEELEFNMDYFELLKYCKALGFSRYVSQYSKFLDMTPEQIHTENHKIIEVQEFKITDHIDLETAIYTQTLTDNYFESACLGVGLCSEKGNFFLKMENLNEEFYQWLADSKYQKITYNLKRMLVKFSPHQINGVSIDLQLAITLLNPSNYKLAFEGQLAKYGIDFISYHSDVYKTKTNPQIPEFEILMNDIGKKAVALHKASLKILNLIEKNCLEKVLYEIEIPLSYVLAGMELVGIFIDQTTWKKLFDQYENMEKNAIKEIESFTDINFKSPSQLSEFLFETLNLPQQGLKKTASKTKKMISTDVDNLNKLLEKLDVQEYDKEYKFINDLLEYRTFNKLKTTYLEGIYKYIDEDSRIHPIFHQLQSETGRISTQDPSIQNIPIRTKLGKNIRSLFSSTEDKKIIALDYSQIELRVMAELTHDENLVKAFIDNKDIHLETAIAIFGDENLKENRTRAKEINFGIIYGMSTFGLSSRVGISNVEAKEFIDKYFQTYPGIKNYLSSQVEFAKDHGYVETIMQRRRFVENIDAGSFQEKEHAKRVAINTPVQGSAADLIKLAMININKNIIKDNPEIEMIMQIHDELVFEVDCEKAKYYTKLIKNEMENVLNLSVPLIVDGSIGDNWLEAK